MKRALLLASFVLPLLSLGQGWLSSITVSNSTPNACDPVTVTINGTKNCGNSTMVLGNTSISGNTVTIYVDDYLPSPICLPVIAPFSVTTSSFVLPSGTDTIIAVLTWNGVFKESMSTTISVSGGGAMTQNIAICQDDSLFVGGAWQSQAGSYTDTLFGTSCDTIITTNLSIKQYEVANKSENICTGDSAFLGGAWQHIPGIYADTLDMPSGCDSIFMTTLSIHATDSTSANARICDGEEYWAGGAYQTTSGIYYDVYTNMHGCDSVKATVLTVDAVPSKPVIQPIGQDSLRSSVGGTDYDWFFNSVKLGVHTRSISLDYYGDFEVLVYNNDCVSDTSDVYTATDPTIGIIEGDLTYSLYPNPAQSVIHLDGTDLQSFRLLDLNGRTIMEGTLDNGTNEIILPALSRGMYIMEILGEELVARHSVLIE